MRHSKRFSFILFITVSLIGFQYESHGQNENQPGTWLTFSGTTKIHEHWSIPSVGMLKHHDLLEKYSFSFLRTGISYRLDNYSTFTGGIAFFNSSAYTENNEVKNTSQIWFYGEYFLNLKFNRSILGQRFRLENRRTTNSINPEINNRFRYRLQYTNPIGHKTYFKSYNEIFLKLEDSSFCQNRFYIGVGQSLSQSIKVEVGYLMQHFKTSSEAIFCMGLTFNLDLTQDDLAMNSD